MEVERVYNCTSAEEVDDMVFNYNIYDHNIQHSMMTT
jgi:hypothetical protein